MSLKLKALGLGLLAVLATSALAVNASATKSGHFVAEPPAGDHHVVIKGTELTSSSHSLSFYRTDASGNTIPENEPIKCTHVAYHGTLTGDAATTTQAVSVRPDYTGINGTGLENCSTGAKGPHNVEVHVPSECGTNVFEFTSGNAGTVHVRCKITITHPNCTIVVPAQENLTGITYTTIETNGKHALTVNSNVKGITGHFEGGICFFLGTSHRFEMVGSATVWGENTAGGAVGITHTDP